MKTMTFIATMAIGTFGSIVCVRSGTRVLAVVKWGIAFVDLDNDGWLDLITASGHVYPQMNKLPSDPGYRQSKLLSLNQGDGTFCDASDQAGRAEREACLTRLAVADLFNDGNMDVVINDLDGAQ